jgi:diguanylate cyclase (GGDEF)-like protein
MDVRVLIVDDDPVDRELFIRLMNKTPDRQYEYLEATSGEMALGLCRTSSPDCILLDYRLPDQTGIEFLNLLAEEGLGDVFPVVMLTGQGDESTAVSAMKLGCQDYLVKGEVTAESLSGAILNAIRKMDMKHESDMRQEELERLSRLDDLTGLLNRRAIMDIYRAEYVRAHRYRRSLSVLMMDLDNFKMVNDTRGHVVGDGVLRDTGKIVMGVLRGSDAGGRYGGEEFLVVLPEATGEGAAFTAERIREEVQDRSFVDRGGVTFKVTTSIGIATLTPDDEIADRLLERADEALYQAKHMGRNRVVAHDEPAGRGIVAESEQTV